MPAITVENDSGIAVPQGELLAQAAFMLAELGLHPGCELSVTLVDIPDMTELHVRWMDEPGPTDVLSFPMDELRLPAAGEAAAPGILGDIVICPQVASEQAGAAGHSLADELTVLLTHGILHLLGFDHATPTEHAEMFGRQDQLIAAWREHERGSGQ